MPAGNTDCFSNDVVTTPAPSGNLIESNQGCGTAVSSEDPHLAALDDNGGSTATMALLLPSPAVDASVAPDCLPTDQRGITRPADGDSDGTAICDLGEFELEPTTSCSGGCDDGNPCTADACVAGSCTHPTGPADGTSCDDADTCSGPDVQRRVRRPALEISLARRPARSLRRRNDRVHAS
jgi:hypothetical protein